MHVHTTTSRRTDTDKDRQTDTLTHATLTLSDKDRHTDTLTHATLREVPWHGKGWELLRPLPPGSQTRQEEGFQDDQGLPGLVWKGRRERDTWQNITPNAEGWHEPRRKGFAWQNLSTRIHWQVQGTGLAHCFFSIVLLAIHRSIHLVHLFRPPFHPPSHVYSRRRGGRSCISCMVPNSMQRSWRKWRDWVGKI